MANFKITFQDSNVQSEWTQEVSDLATFEHAQGYARKVVRDHAHLGRKVEIVSIRQLEEAGDDFFAPERGTKTPAPEQESLVKELEAISSWNDFARSLCQSYRGYGSLTVNQELAARKMLQKLADRKKSQKPNAPRARFPELARVMFAASESLKWPKLRLKDEEGRELELGIFGERSRYAGQIKVLGSGDEYWGRIDVFSNFFDRDAPQWVVDLLNEFDRDPLAAAKVQGIRTGQCMCCGRELTNPESIELGIGPICRQKWGI